MWKRMSKRRYSTNTQWTSKCRSSRLAIVHFVLNAFTQDQKNFFFRKFFTSFWSQQHFIRFFRPFTQARKRQKVIRNDKRTNRSRVCDKKNKKTILHHMNKAWKSYEFSCVFVCNAFNNTLVCYDLKGNIFSYFILNMGWGTCMDYEIGRWVGQLEWKIYFNSKFQSKKEEAKIRIRQSNVVKLWNYAPPSDLQATVNYAGRVYMLFNY